MYIGGLAAFELLKKDGCGRSRDLRSSELGPATGLFKGIYPTLSLYWGLFSNGFYHMISSKLAYNG